MLSFFLFLVVAFSICGQTAGTIYYDASTGMSLDELRGALPDYIEYNGVDDDGFYVFKERNDNGIVVRKIRAYINDDGLKNIKTQMIHSFNCSTKMYFKTRGRPINDVEIQETYTRGSDINVSKDRNAQIAIKKSEGVYVEDFGAFSIPLYRPRMNFESIVKETERGRYKEIHFSEGKYLEVYYGAIEDMKDIEE